MKLFSFFKNISSFASSREKDSFKETRNKILPRFYNAIHIPRRFKNLLNSSPTSAIRIPNHFKSPSESHRSITIPKYVSFWRKLLLFTGPGFVVAVGYMDPGNWATDLAAGSQFNYSLLCVVFASSVMAMLLQNLSLKLGIVTERDLAQSCREHYQPYVNFILWILCELAIIACDLAEVIGSAIALNLLFHLPILWGVAITSLDTLALLFLQKKGFRYLEALIITLIGVIGICFGLEILFSRPSGMAIAAGFVPHLEVVTHPDMLYIAIGILGATVMPHNLYLHSSIVQTRSYPLTQGGKKEALRFASLDSNIALFLAMLINAAILIVAAATFFKRGRTDVAQIEEAYQLLTPMLGITGASTLFAIALLAAGQNSTLTGTMAGQIIMEGFLNLRMKPWVRRLLTRALAIVPTFLVVWIMGDRGMNQLLLASQVVLSMQLSFAVIPLVQFTSDPQRMGEFVNSSLTKIVAWSVALIIAGLNVWLLVLTVKS